MIGNFASSIRYATRTALALPAVVLTASFALAQSPEAFYRGKTVTILIGHPAGGS